MATRDQSLAELTQASGALQFVPDHESGAWPFVRVIVLNGTGSGSRLIFS